MGNRESRSVDAALTQARGFNHGLQDKVRLRGLRFSRHRATCFAARALIHRDSVAT